MKKIILLFFILILTGCTAVRTFIVGTDRIKYEQQLSEIEQNYKNGNMSYAEYMQLKLQLEQNYSLKGIEHSVQDDRNK